MFSNVVLGFRKVGLLLTGFSCSLPLQQHHQNLKEVARYFVALTSSSRRVTAPMSLYVLVIWLRRVEHRAARINHPKSLHEMPTVCTYWWWSGKETSCYKGKCTHRKGCKEKETTDTTDIPLPTVQDHKQSTANDLDSFCVNHPKLPWPHTWSLKHSTSYLHIEVRNIWTHRSMSQKMNIPQQANGLVLWLSFWPGTTIKLAVVKTSEQSLMQVQALFWVPVVDRLPSQTSTAVLVRWGVTGVKLRWLDCLPLASDEW